MGSLTATMSRFLAWTKPRDGAGGNPFRLACTLDPPASVDEIRYVWSERALPEDLVELWSVCRSARLFEDVDYGQWGLGILTPDQCVQRSAQEQHARPHDIRVDDFVIGEFLGDLELLIYASDVGSPGVLVASPLDHRDDWYVAASGLDGFFTRYLDNLGDKYWES